MLILALSGPLIGTGQGVDLVQLESGLPDSYRLIRALIYVCLFGLSAISVVSSSRAWRLSGTGLRWMFYYGMLATASSIYSVGMFISLWKGFEVLTMVLVLISISSSLRTQDDAKWLLDLAALICLYLLMTVLGGMIIAPGQAFINIDPLTGKGFFGARGLAPNMNPATEGAVSAILAVIVLARLLGGKITGVYSKEKFGLIAILIVAVFFLLFARSRTQLFSFIIAVMGMMIFSRRYKLFALTSILALITVVTSASVINYISRGQTAEEMSSLTGRVWWWGDILEKLSGSPFFGGGFYAAQKLLYGVGVLDNTYLEIYVGLGIVGLIIIFIPLLAATRLLWQTRPLTGIKGLNDLLWLQSGAIFTILIVRSVTTSTFASMHAMMFFYLLTHASIAVVARIKNSPEEHIPPAQDATIAHVKPGNILRKRSRSTVFDRRDYT